MRLIIKKLVLQALAEKNASIVTGCSKETAPVLKNFHIEAKDGRIRSVATDQDLTVIAESTLVSIEDPGEAIIPAKVMLDICRKAQDVDIIMETMGDKATVQAAQTKWDLQLMKEKYPPIPAVTNIEWQSIPAEALMKAVKKVKGAVGIDTSRPELTLIKFGADGVFATDGTRLHHANIKIPVELELQGNAADELVKIMRTSQDQAVLVAQTPTHVLFKIANDVFLATKLNVHFPPTYKMILAGVEGNKTNLQMSKQDLAGALSRVQITADSETNKLSFTLMNHKLLIETRDKNGNSCVESLPVHWPHPTKVVHMNWVNLQEAISDMESPNIVISFGDDQGVKLAPIGVREDNFIAVLNQLRVVGAQPTNAAKPATAA